MRTVSRRCAGSTPSPTQVEGSDEAGTTVEDSVHDGADKLAGGEVVFGQHHMSVMALAPDLTGLNRALSDITAELSRMSIVPVRQTLNTELGVLGAIAGKFQLHRATCVDLVA